VGIDGLLQTFKDGVGKKLEYLDLSYNALGIEYCYVTVAVATFNVL